AAQCALIGVAVSELYPHIAITGQFGWSAEEFKDLFSSAAFRGANGPEVRWDLLNYWRLLNNIRVQDARFQELVAKYQNTVIQANAEVEDGLVTFLKAHQRVRSLTEATNAEQKALKEAVAQYQGGITDFNRVALVKERLVERQEAL